MIDYFGPCTYHLAYSGMCCMPGVRHLEKMDYCEDHKDIMCLCGKKAVRECATMEALCLMPLCLECECKHGA